MSSPADPVEVLAVDQRFLERLQRRYPRIASRVFLNLTRIVSDRLQRMTESLCRDSVRVRNQSTKHAELGTRRSRRFDGHCEVHPFATRNLPLTQGAPNRRHVVRLCVVDRRMTAMTRARAE